MKLLVLLSILLSIAVANENYYYNNNKKVTLIKMNSLMKRNAMVDYYQDDNGITLGVTNKIILKLKNQEIVDKYLQKFDAILEKKLTANMYLLKISDKKLSLKIANKLRKEDGVMYAHPDFIKKNIRR